MTAPQTPSFPSSTTRTTIMIAGASQQVRLDVTSALTASAAVFATIGAVRMVFTDPAVVRGLVAVLRRPVTDGATTVLPEQFLLRPDRFATDEHVVTVHWSTVPPSKITPGGAFDPQRRRHIHWVDVETGPPAHVSSCSTPIVSYVSCYVRNGTYEVASIGTQDAIGRAGR